jgi:hypothetical protein
LPGANFLAVKNPTDDCRSMWPHRHQRECFEVKLHPPRFDLGEVENVINQGEQMPASAEYAIERFS